MPYIKQEEKDNILVMVPNHGFVLDYQAIETPGQLNYAITVIIKSYLNKKGTKYQFINDIVGALTCAKDEFQRRFTNPYEDLKMQENGDV